MREMQMVKIIITTKTKTVYEVYTKTNCIDTRDILTQAFYGEEFATYFIDKEGTGIIIIRIDGIESAYVSLFQD